VAITANLAVESPASRPVRAVPKAAIIIITTMMITITITITITARATPPERFQFGGVQ